MKKLTFSKSLLALVSLVVLGAFSVFAAPAAAGITVCMALVAGTAVTTDAVRSEVETLDLEDISKTVTEILPARVPMNKIMREIRKATKVESELIRYYSVVSKELYDIPDDAASGAGTSSGSPCEAYTYSSGDGLLSIWVQVTTPDLWVKDGTCIMFDLLCNAAVAASPTAHQNVAFWVKTKTGSLLELVPLNGCLGSGANAAKFVVPNFAKTQKIYQAGVAKPQTAMQAVPFAILPTADEQACQNFMAQIEESTFQRMTKKEVNFGFPEYEKQNIYNMAIQQEISFLFGVKDHLYDSNDTDYRYTTEGITRRIDTNLAYGTGGSNRTVSTDDYLTWLETVFTGNNGSDTRVLFAGSGLMKSLHSIDEYTKQVNGRDPFVDWGVKFKKITSDFGELLVAQHPLFTQLGLNDYGLILDMAHITKNDFLPMQVTVLDLRKSGTRNVDAKVIQEVSALTLANPDCHAIIKPKA